MKLNEQIKETTTPQHIGHQIRAVRKSRGLTQKQLADKLNWKYQQIQRIERTGNCSIKSLSAIGTILEQIFFIPISIKF